MFLSLILMEYRKLFFRRVFRFEIYLLLTTTIPIVLFSYLLRDIPDSSEALKPLSGYSSALDKATFGFITGMLIPLTVTFASYILNFLVVILVGLTCAQEFSWHTMQLWLSRGVSRTHLLQAKALMLLCAVFVMFLALFFVSAVFSTLSSVFLYGALPSLRIDLLADILFVYIRTLYTLLPYMALTFLIAILTHSVSAAIGFGLTFIVIIQTLLTQILQYFGKTGDIIAHFLPQSLADVLFRQMNGSTSGSSEAFYPTMTTATLGIAAHTIIFLSIAFWHFQRQDLTN